MRGFAGFIALVTGLLIAGLIYLTFYFPKIVNVWQEQGKALSGIQVAMAKISVVCISYWVVILPILVIGFLVSLIAAIRG